MATEAVEWAARLFSERASDSAQSDPVTVIDLTGRNGASIRDPVESAYISLIVDSSDDGDSDRFHSVLQTYGVCPEFSGVCKDGQGRITQVGVCRGATPPRIVEAPEDFKVVAIIPTFNEEDVIEVTIDHLVSNGVMVYLMDNWSTDRTFERALKFEARGLIGHEHFPDGGPSSTYDLSALQERMEAIADNLDVDWIVSNDADELRSPPWEGITLRDGLYHVQQEGYSAVNFTALNFALTRDTYTDGADVSEHLQWFQFEVGSIRLNTWRKQPGARAELAWSGGHEVRFPGVRVFPYNFLLRHYPIRSVAQGRRKVFKERLPRFPVDERLRGWHSHYDDFKENRLLQRTTGLIRYDEDFPETYLLQRLAGPVPSPAVPTGGAKGELIRLMRRTGLLEPALRMQWRLRGRAAR